MRVILDARPCPPCARCDARPLRRPPARNSARCDARARRRPRSRARPRRSWKMRGGPVSRVLSWAAIYLLRSSPTASSAQPERSAGHTMALLFAFAPDGACQAVALPRRWWSLTPPFQLFPLRGPRAGQLESSFLRRFPSGYPARPLAGILPCGARTFLKRYLSAFLSR